MTDKKDTSGPDVKNAFIPPNLSKRVVPSNDKVTNVRLINIDTGRTTYVDSLSEALNMRLPGEIVTWDDKP